MAERHIITNIYAGRGDRSASHLGASMRKSFKDNLAKQEKRKPERSKKGGKILGN